MVARWLGQIWPRHDALVRDLGSGSRWAARVVQCPGVVVAPAMGCDARRSGAHAVVSRWCGTTDSLGGSVLGHGRLLLRYWIICGRTVATFASSPRRSGSTFVEELALSQLRSIARIAPCAIGPTSSRARCCRTEIASCARCSRTDLVSHTVPRDRACIAPDATGRVSGGQFWLPYWVFALGLPRGVNGRTFPLISLIGVAADLGRWCLGLGCRGGGPRGGCAVLMGRAHGLVLPGGHGRVGGVVAGEWRSVAVSVGWGENLLFLRMDWR